METPTIILKVMSPMFLVKVGDWAVEVERLWDEVLKLKNEQQYLDDEGNGYGAPDLDLDIAQILESAGFAKPGAIGGNYVPTPALDSLYEDLFSFLETARLEPEKVNGGPQFVWPYEEVKPPDFDSLTGRRSPKIQ